MFCTNGILLRKLASATADDELKTLVGETKISVRET
jgi:hypothetical protein